jgi:hypothetical protein
MKSKTIANSFNPFCTMDKDVITGVKVVCVALSLAVTSVFNLNNFNI